MGLLTLFLATVWFVAVIVFATFIARKLSLGVWRIPVGVLLATVLYPLPLVDEIVGGMQFKRLCEENETIYVSPTAKGRTAYLAETPLQEVKGPWVRVTRNEWRYADAKTGETVIRFNTLTAGHGFFHIGESPLTFHSYCAPRSRRPSSSNLLEEFGVTVVERPKSLGISK